MGVLFCFILGKSSSISRLGSGCNSFRAYHWACIHHWICCPYYYSHGRLWPCPQGSSSGEILHSIHWRFPSCLFWSKSTPRHQYMSGRYSLHINYSRIEECQSLGFKLGIAIMGRGGSKKCILTLLLYANPHCCPSPWSLSWEENLLHPHFLWGRCKDWDSKMLTRKIK